MKTSIFKGHLLQAVTPEAQDKYSMTSREVGFLNEKIDTLAQIGVKDWEQFYSLLKIKSIKKQLKSTIRLTSDSEIFSLIELCEKILPDFRVQQLNRIDFNSFALGAKKPKNRKKSDKKFKAYEYLEHNRLMEINRKLSDVEALDKISSFQYASSINHIEQLNFIRSQGERGTCSSFAVTSANEFSVFKNTGNRFDLSEQYLFYKTKISEGDDACGSWVQSAMEVISYNGQCEEGIWSYNPINPCVQEYGKPSNADNEAVRFKNTFFEIKHYDLSALKQVLSSGRIIPFSIPVFSSWYDSLETIRTGRITMPLKGEQEYDSGHSMVLVGYQDNLTSPGGGYFLLRNSWGTDWGRDNYYGSGYGTIPYAYITEYSWEAYAF